MIPRPYFPTIAEHMKYFKSLRWLNSKIAVAMIVLGLLELGFWCDSHEEAMWTQDSARDEMQGEMR